MSNRERKPLEKEDTSEVSRSSSAVESDVSTIYIKSSTEMEFSNTNDEEDIETLRKKRVELEKQIAEMDEKKTIN